METGNEADLTISRMANGVDFEFDRRDYFMSKHCRMLTVHLAKTKDLPEMLQSLSQTDRNPLEEPIYEPDNVDNMIFRPNGVHVISVPENAGLGKIYGSTLQNNSEHELFPYLFYFDPIDYNVQASSRINPEASNNLSHILLVPSREPVSAELDRFCTKI